MTSPIFALTARGLEAVVQAELETFAGVQIQSQAYRRVHGIGDPGALTSLRCADDLFIEVDHWDDVMHTRDMLAEFTDLGTRLDLEPAVMCIKQIRQLPDAITFSVTANFVGKRNYNQNEIKSFIAAGILYSNPEWSYSEDDAESALNVRVFIEHQTALIGVRLTANPLHRRSYKQTSLAGSLKATVAASMIQLTQASAGQTLLDPFCGSGTILIEAAQQGLISIGGDISPAALHITQENTHNADANIQLAQWAGGRLPLKDHSIHAIVSNLPWGRQIQVDDSLHLLYQHAYAEMQRVIMPDGVLVLLTTLPELLPDSPAQSFEISLYGQNPQVMIFRS